MSPRSVFVSYRRADKDAVQPLVDALREAKLRVFWDQDIVPGDKWLARILDELEQASAFIGVWSRNSISDRGEFLPNSDGIYYTRIEHVKASQLGLPMFPVSLPGNSRSLEFSHLQALPMSSLDQQTIKNVSASLTEQIQRSHPIHRQQDQTINPIEKSQFEVLIYCDSTHGKSFQGIEAFAEIAADLFKKTNAIFCNPETLVDRTNEIKLRLPGARTLLCYQRRDEEPAALGKRLAQLKVELGQNCSLAVISASEPHKSALGNHLFPGAELYPSAGALRDQLLLNGRLLSGAPVQFSTDSKIVPRVVFIWGEDDLDRLGVHRRFATQGIRAAGFWDRYLTIEDPDQGQSRLIKAFGTDSNSVELEELNIQTGAELKNADVKVYLYTAETAYVGPNPPDFIGDTLHWLYERGEKWDTLTEIDPEYFIGNEAHLRQIAWHRAKRRAAIKKSIAGALLERIGIKRTAE